MSIINNNDLVYCREFVVYRNFENLSFDSDTNQRTAESVLYEVERCISSDFHLIDLNNEKDKDLLYSYNSTLFIEEFSSKYPYIKIFICDNLLLILNTLDHIELRYIEYDFKVSSEEIISKLNILLKTLTKYTSFAIDNGNYINSTRRRSGTGLYINTYIHVPILLMLNKIEENYLKDKGIVIFKENNVDSNPMCALIQFSNIDSLFSSWEVQLEKYNDILNNLLNDEIVEQKKIFLSNINNVKDKILKAYGIIKYSLFLDDYEYISLFNFFRAACEFKIFSLTVNQVDRIFRFIHLKTYFIEDFEESCENKSKLIKRILLPIISKSLEA